MQIMDRREPWEPENIWIASKPNEVTTGDSERKLKMLIGQKF
jgi:hypothetical protein